jgi:hypothetical protein
VRDEGLPAVFGEAVAGGVFGGVGVGSEESHG